MFWMKLFLAEKPSLAKAIAEGLGKPKRKDGYYECKGDQVVSWCFGHLLEQFSPEQYDPSLKKWSEETLPFQPDIWKVGPRDDKGVRKQLGVIQQLFLRCTTLVNAGDPDREGQLLVDEIFDFLGNKKPVERIWLAAIDPLSVSKALQSLESNEKYLPLKYAAMARSRADWLVGLNLTRAMTLSAQRQGLEGVLSIGRVQTPTLSLIVQRDREIDDFKSIDFFVPKITIKHENGSFEGIWIPNEKHDIDPENRLIDLTSAQNIVTNLKGQRGGIAKVKKEKKKKAPPLPYSLSVLQKDASAKFGLSAKETLSIAQALYESQLTSYPRSDCRYLPEEQLSDAHRILQSLVLQGFKLAKDANVGIKSVAWNSKKITAHHGIIPTGEEPKSLTGNNKKLYNLIVESYIRQFYPSMEYVSQQIISAIGCEKWKTTGSQILDPGWTVVGQETTKDKILPDVKEQDDILCTEAQVDKKQTKPPARFTEGTLIDAMSNVHKFVKNPQIKAILKENSGIGTEATRAGIIETLFNRAYLKKKGKQIISTELGRTVIDVTPESLTDPGTTALWEDYLKQIAEGHKTMDSFMSQQTSTLPTMVKIALNAKFPKSIVGVVHKCPECQHALKKLKSKNDSKYYWVCFNKEKHSNGKPLFRPDKNGKPGKPSVKKDISKLPKTPCPEKGCIEQMVLLTSTKNKDFHFWKCKNNDHPLRYDVEGHPGEPIVFKKKGKKK
jgi:DNA topoisomerase-3